MPSSLQPPDLQHARLPCSLSFTVSWSLLTLMSIESVMPSNPLILCSPLLLLPSIFPSIRVFSDESALLLRWSRYCSFSFSFSPSNEYSGLNFFRMDWFDLLAVQGTLKSLLPTPQLKSISSLALSLLYDLRNATVGWSPVWGSWKLQQTNSKGRFANAWERPPFQHCQEIRLVVKKKTKIQLQFSCYISVVSSV